MARSWRPFGPGRLYSELPARLVLANGIVVDMVGTVRLEIDYPFLFGDEIRPGYGCNKLQVTMTATDFEVYLPGEQAPEHNSKLRALPSGADRLPLERVDGEILPED